MTEEDFDDDVEYISTDALEECEFAWDIIVATLVFEGVVYNWIQKFKNPGKKGPQPWSCILALAKHFRQDRNVENGEEICIIRIAWLLLLVWSIILIK